MDTLFENREIPRFKKKINSKILNAIDVYRRFYVPMNVLLNDYLAVLQNKDELNCDAVNPWAYFYKGMEKHEIETGISVDETYCKIRILS